MSTAEIILTLAPLLGFVAFLACGFTIAHIWENRS